ncbi:MAG: excinuclease ABC subunit C, partial [Actinomycetales bacterium]|nr:excinuclease ABC subunit C [Actinomycetales bacterium]
LPRDPDPVILSRSSQGLYLLQRTRDEAHRFAITHHRKSRGRAAVTSKLDEVPGIGPTRRKVLLKHFGSFKALKAATVDEVAEAPGIGLVTAKSIVQALQEQAPQVKVDMSTGEIIEESK